MGYTMDGGITNYWPDDDENTLYIASCCDTLQEILDKAQENWPGIEMKSIRIEAQNIHTNCIYYDCYDPGDYTDFLILTRLKNETS